MWMNVLLIPTARGLEHLPSIFSHNHRLTFLFFIKKNPVVPSCIFLKQIFRSLCSPSLSTPRHTLPRSNHSELAFSDFWSSGRCSQVCINILVLLIVVSKTLSWFPSLAAFFLSTLSLSDSSSQMSGHLIFIFEIFTHSQPWFLSVVFRECLLPLL